MLLAAWGSVVHWDESEQCRAIDADGGERVISRGVEGLRLARMARHISLLLSIGSLSSNDVTNLYQK